MSGIMVRANNLLQTVDGTWFQLRAVELIFPLEGSVLSKDHSPGSAGVMLASTVLETLQESAD